MVPTNDDSKHRSAALPRIVFVEVTEMAMSPRHRHAVEVALVADSLDDLPEVNAKEQPGVYAMLSNLPENHHR